MGHSKLLDLVAAKKRGLENLGKARKCWLFACKGSVLAAHRQAETKRPAARAESRETYPLYIYTYLYSYYNA
jgi:hypothetical protein